MLATIFIYINIMASFIKLMLRSKFVHTIEYQICHDLLLRAREKMFIYINVYIRGIQTLYNR